MQNPVSFRKSFGQGLKILTRIYFREGDKNMNSTNINPIDEKLPFGKNILLALQHVFVMVAGAVVVPISIAGAAGVDDATFLISCTLFAAGIATLLQCLGLKNFSGAKVAIVEGTSFAALAATKSIIEAGGGGVDGLCAVSGAVMVAGVFCVLISKLWSKLLKFFPDVVTGTVITVIGLSLFPISIKWIANNDPEQMANGVSLSSMAVALITLIIILVCNKFLKGLIGNLSVLIGIACGTGVVLLHDAINPAAPMMSAASIEQLKDASLFGMVYPFKYGAPTFSLNTIIPMIIAMLVIMTQATGSMMAIFNISGREIDEESLNKGLRSNGISTFIAGLFNSYPVTAFAQNIGMLNLTNVVSRFVTATAGGILIVLAFLPKFAATFAAIPKPVLGGAGFVMFGVVIVNGIRTLAKVSYDNNKNSIIVAVSIGLSLIPTVIPSFFAAMPVGVCGVLNDITLGSVSAILLNLFFNVFGTKK